MGSGNYQPSPQLAVIDINLGGPMSILYAGSFFMTFSYFYKITLTSIQGLTWIRPW